MRGIMPAIIDQAGRQFNVDEADGVNRRHKGQHDGGSMSLAYRDRVANQRAHPARRSTAGVRRLRGYDSKASGGPRGSCARHERAEASARAAPGRHDLCRGAHSAPPRHGWAPSERRPAGRDRGGVLELPRFRGRVPAFGSRHPRGVLDLIAQRRLVVQSRVPPVRVAPPLEEVEDRDPRLSRGREAPAVEELAFEGREEALRHRVVVGVAHRPHRGADPGGLTAEAESEGGVLRGPGRSGGSPAAAGAGARPSAGRRGRAWCACAWRPPSPRWPGSKCPRRTRRRRSRTRPRRR